MNYRGRGFTLIEVVVAFAILAVSLATLYQAFAVALRGGGRAEHRASAVAHAQSLLARVSHDLPLREGRQEGHAAEDLMWTIDVSAYPPAEPKRPWPLPVYDVAIRVSWGDSPADSVTLNSLELGHLP